MQMQRAEPQWPTDGADTVADYVFASIAEQVSILSWAQRVMFCELCEHIFVIAILAQFFNHFFTLCLRVLQ